MEFDDRALPMTQRRLAIRLAQEASRTGAEGHLGQFKKIREPFDSHLPERAPSKVLREANSLTADFFETDGPVSQKTIDYTDDERAGCYPSCSRHPVQEAPELASSLQRAPMPCAGPLLKFAFLRNRPAEY